MSNRATFSIGCSSCGARFAGFSLVNDPDIDECGAVIFQATEGIKESWEAHAAGCAEPRLCLFRED